MYTTHATCWSHWQCRTISMPYRRGHSMEDALTKYEHISPCMWKLHWLKVNERKTYKLVTFVFQCAKGDAPKSLSDMLARTHGHHLRTSAFNKLPISRSNIAQEHNGSFKSVGLRIWNSLLNDVTSCNTLEAFKRKLKTHLFRLSYNLT